MVKNINKICKFIMSLKPEVLLSLSSREQCILKINELPKFVEREQRTKAAVLVPLCVVDNEVCLLYTLRSSTLSSHSGQVSFPGGKIDPGESVYQTAVREAEEEIGLLPHQIDIWTKMTKLHGRDSSMIITPVVGELKNVDIKSLQGNESEVAEIFTVPMRVLCDKNNHAHLTFNDIGTPVYNCGKHKVWGITGLITHLFLQCLLPSDIYDVDFTRKSYQLDELLPSKL